MSSACNASFFLVVAGVLSCASSSPNSAKVLSALGKLKDSVDNLQASTDARFDTTDARFDNLQGTTDARFDNLQATTDARFADLRAHVDRGFASMEDGATLRTEVLKDTTMCKTATNGVGMSGTLHAVRYGDTVTAVTAAHVVGDLSAHYIVCGPHDLAVSKVCPTMLTASGVPASGPDAVVNAGLQVLDISGHRARVRLGQDVVSYGCGDVGMAFRSIFSSDVGADIPMDTKGSGWKGSVMKGEHTYFGGAHNGTSGAAVVYVPTMHAVAIGGGCFLPHLCHSR